MNTTWKLEKLFYTSLTDPQIEKDVRKGERAYERFCKKWETDTKFLTNSSTLKKALDEYSALSTQGHARPLLYTWYVKELDASNKKALALSKKLEERYIKRGNSVIFFETRLANIPQTTKKKFLQSEELRPYQYYLEILFENAKYILSEKEEKILSLKADTSYGRWVDMTDMLLAESEVLWKRKKLPLGEALGKFSKLTTKERQELWRKITEAMYAFRDSAEHEMNAVITHKKVDDELRGYKNPYESTIRSYENDPVAIEALIDVTTKNFNIAHRFYRIKARMLELPSLTYADRAAPVGKEPRVSFSAAVKLLQESFTAAHPRYEEIFTRLIENGQVDVYPKKGKGGGAYCSHDVESPTMVLLNHTDDLSSLQTLAHEMGHAIHTERSKKQPALYESYTTSVAETASTLFEQIGTHAMIETLSGKERLVAEHNLIQEDISTIFRQIAFFNFEKDLHHQVRTEGYISHQEMAKLLNKHTGAYLGKAVTLDEKDGYFFVYLSHIRRFFYVYSYAYGKIVSKALYKRLREDPSYIDQIDEFLSAGASASPEDIFAKAGIDVRSKVLFEEGLQELERQVKAFERRVAKEWK